jgi:hypothetical protein
MIPTLYRFEIGDGEVNYQNFLHKKSVVDRPTGLSSLPPLNDMLFDFQQDIVLKSYCIRRGTWHRTTSASTTTA